MTKNRSNQQPSFSGESPDELESARTKAVTKSESPVEAAASPSSHHQKVKRTVAGSTWVALIIGAILLVLLLVFILQNQQSVRLHMLWWDWNFPMSVGMLIAAIMGALIMAIVGGVRIVQLRRQVQKGLLP